MRLPPGPLLPWYKLASIASFAGSDNKMTPSKRILVMGVTASGKGRLAFDLAQHLRGEIISVDSMKVYRRMDVGTAKPSKEAQSRVPYHMIDVVEPSEAYDVATFYEQATRMMEQIQRRERPAILVGGTALYIKALLFGLFAGPAADDAVRQRLKQRIEREGLDSLHGELVRVDPGDPGQLHTSGSGSIRRPPVVSTRMTNAGSFVLWKCLNSQASRYRVCKPSLTGGKYPGNGPSLACVETRPWRTGASTPVSKRWCRRV